MNNQQEEHLHWLLRAAQVRIDGKFREGDAEHKDTSEGIMCLTPTQLLACAIDEAVDQLVYLLTIQRKLDRGEAQ